MVKLLRPRWLAVVAIGLVIALVNVVLMLFCLAQFDWLYISTINTLTLFQRLGLPTLGPSIEGWPLPSVVGWNTILIILWCFYTGLLALACSLRFTVRKTM